MYIKYISWIIYILWIKDIHCQKTIFTEQPLPITEIDPGHSVSLKCRTSGPILILQWYKDDVIFFPMPSPLYPPEGVSLSTDYLSTGILDLHITNVDLRKHDGKYNCRVYYNREGDTLSSNSTRLIVRKAPEELIIIYKNTKLKNGDTIEAEANVKNLPLYCVAKRANPPAILQWFINDVPVESNADQVNTNDQSDQKLHNSQVQFSSNFSWMHNRQKLQCVAKHPSLLQPLWMESILNIYFPPEIQVRIEPTVSDIIENKAVTLVCEVKANPPTTGSWERNGSSIGRDSKIVFPRISRLDGGNYTCTAMNRIGEKDILRRYSYNLDIKYPVLINSIDIKGNPEVGSIISLICGVTGNPKPDVRWIHLDKDTLPKGNVPIINLTVDYSLSGEYQCIGKNKINGQIYESKSERKMLMVQGQPMIQHKEELRMKVFRGESNRDFSLTVSYCSNPHPQSKFILPEGELSQGNRGRFTIRTKQIKSYCYEDELIIREASQQDSGSYEFRISNQYGKDGVTLKIAINAAVDTGLVVGLVIGMVLLAIMCLIIVIYAWREKKLCFQQKSRKDLSVVLKKERNGPKLNDSDVTKIDMSHDNELNLNLAYSSLSVDMAQDRDISEEKVQMTPNFHHHDKIIYAQLDTNTLNRNVKANNNIKRHSTQYADILPKVPSTPTMV